MTDSIPTHPSISPEEYLEQVEAAVAAGDAPAELAETLRHALAVDAEREHESFVVAC